MKNKKVPTRLRFPEEEKQFPWLPMLLDAFAIIDRGVSAAVKEHERRFRTKLACKKSCGSCCRTHSDIPLYPLETVGIYWHTIEKMGGPLREILKRQLMQHENGRPCPFQVDDACSIHSFRPIACRQFNVFAAPCAEGEDPFYTRRQDVLTPIQKYTHQAIAATLPFYGITDAAAQVRAVRGGFIHTQVRVLSDCDWKSLAVRMNEFDLSREQG
jgi:Fe-S-cluster containining protein